MSETSVLSGDVHKKKRARSPGYPGIGLKEAVERAQLLYDHEKRNWIHIDTALHHWGYKPKSGQGLVTVSALIKFALLVDDGSGPTRKVKLSDLGLRIILLDDSEHASERRRFLQEAALKPAIHAELWRHYDGVLPSDVSLRRELILERSFTESAVREFVPEFRGTIAFAGLTPADKLTGNAGDSQDEPRDPFVVPPVSVPGAAIAHPQASAESPRGKSPTTSTRVISLPLPGDTWAALQVPYPMSNESWDYMMKMLEFMKRGILGTAQSQDPETASDTET